MIRPGRFDDLTALAAVERSASELFAGTHMHWAAGGPTLPRRLLTEAVERGLLFVADPGRPAGFIVAAPSYNTLYVQELSVARSHQRRGLGSQLMAALVAHGKAQGRDAITLTTDRDLPWNRPFYARMGFVELVGAACPPWLAARLRTQAEHGNDPARRCAMRLALR